MIFTLTIWDFLSFILICFMKFQILTIFIPPILLPPMGLISQASEHQIMITNCICLISPGTCYVFRKKAAVTVLLKYDVWIWVKNQVGDEKPEEVYTCKLLLGTGTNWWWMRNTEPLPAVRTKEYKEHWSICIQSRQPLVYQIFVEPRVFKVFLFLPNTLILVAVVDSPDFHDS